MKKRFLGPEKGRGYMGGGRLAERWQAHGREECGLEEWRRTSVREKTRWGANAGFAGGNSHLSKAAFLSEKRD